jgi:hypothetical protein
MLVQVPLNIVTQMARQNAYSIGLPLVRLTDRAKGIVVMDRRIAGAVARLTLRALGVAAVIALFAVVLAAAAGAQTLTQPGQPKLSPPANAKSRAANSVKSCSAFGPGFVNIPGTDACIKIGGSATTEISGH